MAYVTNDEIVGYQIKNGGVFCCECFDKEHPNYDITEDEIIAEGARDNFDGLIFCDSCKQQI